MVVLETIRESSDVKKLNIEQLNLLSKEIRQEILQVVSVNGGHLASNLGVVELTVALHAFLNLPQDEIVWDVGHQCYAHKLLTGRRDEFTTLRTYKGLSGFPKPHESPADAYVAGHSSTSISVAVGIAQAAKLQHIKKRVYAVIGDGALSGGMVWEAMNHGGDLKTPFTVILNDNEMSIAENVGAMSLYLTRLRTDKRYRRLKDRVTQFLLSKKKLGHTFYRGLEHLRDAVKYFLVRGVLFEEMGFVYLGPVDGHDIAELLKTLKMAARIEKPVLIHVITQKGRGYAPAEQNPTAFHGVGSFNLTTGEIRPKGRTYTECFSDKLCELAATDQRIVAVTAAMPHGTGLEKFRLQFPERFYDVGIAEQHMVTFSAALALRGMRPVAAVYSTFLQRAYDQLMQDVCLAEAPLVLAVDRAGVVGEDGETHQGLFDIAMLRAMPNMTLLAPRDALTLPPMLEYALALGRPVALRYPRGEAARLASYTPQPLMQGKGEVLAEPAGAQIGLLALGDMVQTALQIAAMLAKRGIPAAVADLRFAKPLDDDLIVDFAGKYGRLLTLEDGIAAGGVGEGIALLLQTRGVKADLMTAAFPDEFVAQGKPAQIFSKYHMTAETLLPQIMRRWFKEINL